MDTGRKTVLILGGAGFIGSNLCERLLEHYNVIAVDSFATSTEQNIDHLLSSPHFEFIRQDLREPLNFESVTALERFRVAYTGIQYVIHCAGRGAPHASATDPIGAQTTITAAAALALEVGVKYGARVLFVSDALIYGPSVSLETSESASPVAFAYDAIEAPNASAWRYAEQLAHAYVRAKKLSVIIGRFGSIYGPRMGFADSRCIPTLISRALHHESLVIPDAHALGSFLGLADALDAIERMMEMEGFRVYTVAQTAQHSFTDVADAIRTATGSSSVITVDSSDPIIQTWIRASAAFDIRKFRDDASWIPVVSLEQGISVTVDYMKSLRNVKTMMQ